MDNYLSGLATEHVNEETRNLDRCSTLDMVDMINRQDAKVADAVAQEKKQIARAVDLICAGLEKGGHLYYLGAGTSGRLGVLDASECVPTFGVSPELVQGFIAGGDTALRNAVEGAEDDAEAGAALVDSLNAGEHDTVVGISASGSAPFVRGALVRARERGCVTVGLCTNKPNKLEALCDVTIAPEVGPEVVSGSTRMKSGTAQKDGAEYAQHLLDGQARQGLRQPDGRFAREQRQAPRPRGAPRAPCDQALKRTPGAGGTGSGGRTRQAGNPDD